jgi:hypothetical protein
MIQFSAIDSGYSTAINNLALLGLAIMQFMAMWWSKKHRQKNNREIAEIKNTTSEIKKSVDGPLGTALATAASAQEAVARLTQDPEKILEAVAARKISDDHNSNQAKALATQTRNDLEKQRIIDDFLAEQKLKNG